MVGAAFKMFKAVCWYCGTVSERF